MLHRLRRAMVRPARQLLTGEVEIDESYLALTDREKPLNKHGRKSNTTKILVAIAVEIKDPKGFGRIRIQQIDKGDTENLMSFIRGSVDPDASIHSDGSGAYLKLQKEGYDHRRTIHLGSDIPAHETMPGVHRVAALLQRWLLGTHHGAIQPKQLDSYLNEFVFRFNRRNSKSRGLLFYRLIQQAIDTQPITYKTVINCAKK
jgi:transposase-like protein